MTGTDTHTDADRRVRVILEETGGVAQAASLSADADLVDAGLTSHMTVTVMLALEDEFDVEFPDALLRRSTFATVGSILAALEELGAL